jgi:polar amino acid transport system substrate-binding protein
MIRFILLILTIVGSSSLYAEKITAVGDPWPPFLDPNQAGKGIIAEIATAAYATQGYELDLKFVPWARAVAGVKNASFDLLIGTWLTEERTNFLMFSQPYLNNSIKFIKKKGDSFNYTDLESLTGKSVGVVIEYGYGDGLLNAKNFRRAEAKNFITNIRKLVAGRIDLTLEDEIVAKAIIAQEQPDLLDKIEFSTADYSTNALYVASGLANAKHEELIEAFNNGLAVIKQSGEYDKIMNSINN